MVKSKALWVGGLVVVLAVLAGLGYWVGKEQMRSTPLEVDLGN